LKGFKLPNEDKAINSLDEKLTEAEDKAGIENDDPVSEDPREIQRRIERKIKAMRAERREKLKTLFGEFAWDHMDDEETDEEINYRLKKALAVPPEVRYQRRKEPWYFHPSSCICVTIMVMMARAARVGRMVVCLNVPTTNLQEG
jgi:hypothetical protein